MQESTEFNYPNWKYKSVTLPYHIQPAGEGTECPFLPTAGLALHHCPTCHPNRMGRTAEGLKALSLSRLEFKQVFKLFVPCCVFFVVVVGR